VNFFHQKLKKGKKRITPFKTALSHRSNRTTPYDCAGEYWKTLLDGLGYTLGRDRKGPRFALPSL
jgi:hypothetical protein